MAKSLKILGGDPAQCLWSRHGLAPTSEQLPDATAIFDPVSGETHFLSELPLILLNLIDGEPVSQAALIDRLAGPIELGGTREAQIFEALLYLEGAELIDSDIASTE